MAVNYNTRIVSTTPYTVTNDDEIIFSNVSGPAAINLPTLSSGSAGRTYIIKDFSGNSRINPITITAPSGKTIDGAAFGMVNTQYGRVWLTYDGTNWKTIAI
jgi:hypothetical protein